MSREQWEPGWAMGASPAAQAELVRIEDVVGAFLRTRTKEEVYREGIRRRILVAPVATACPRSQPFASLDPPCSSGVKVPR